MNHPKKILLLSVIMGSTLTYAELKDPTRPVNAEQQVQRQTPVLSAIMDSNDHRIAVINGHLFRAGEEFEGVKVIAIGAKTVQIETSTGKEVLTLGMSPLQPVK